MTKHLWAELALTLHDDLIRRYSGSYGVRDQALLESALQRPQSGYYEDVISMAAALWESLAQNHPFVDGNKRTAFACMHVFLILNGYTLTADSEKAYDFIMSLYKDNQVSFTNLKNWLEENTSIGAE